MKRIIILFLATLLPNFLNAQVKKPLADSTQVKRVQKSSNTQQSPDHQERTNTQKEGITQKADSTLKEVKIISKKNAVELISGGYRYNVEKANGSAASNIFELLRRVPGVTIDGSNNIRLQGKGPAIMVNGRKVTMSGNDLVAYLKSINAGQVSDIDVNTNPNVTFDADGEGGILNIKLKQRSLPGIFGSVSSNVSSLAGTENSANLNYRKGKWDLSGNYNFSYREDTYTRNNYNENRSLPDSLYGFRQYMVSDKNEKANSFKGGVAYTIDSTSTISAGFFWALFKGNDPWNISARIYDRADIYQRKYLQDEHNSVNNNFYIYDLLYKKAFRNKDQLTIGFNYSSYRNVSGQDYKRTFYDASGNVIPDQLAENRAMQTVRPYQLTTGNVDYGLNLSKTTRLDLGAKYSSTSNGSYFVSALFDPALQQYVNDPALSSTLDYKEHIMAGYGMLSGKLGMLNYQAGLRYEGFAYDLQSPGLGSEDNSNRYHNSYNNLFPSFNLSYHTEDRRSGYAFSFGRRIQRPGYSLLNPFLNVAMVGQYTSGNPYLKPYFVNKAELQYSRNFGDGQFLMLSGYASRARGMFSYIFRYDDKIKMNINTYDNNRSTDQFGAYLVAQNKLSSWFNINAYLAESRSSFSSLDPDDQLMPGIFSFTGNLSLNFTLNSNTQFQFYGYYVSKNNSFNLQNKANGNISFSAQRKFYKNRLTTSVNLEDIFNLNQFPVFIDSRDVYLYSLNKMHSRYIKLGMSYNFGKTFASKLTQDIRKDSRAN